MDLIGERCKVNCIFDEHPIKVLWDLGAQTYIINEQWLPNTVEKTLELLAVNDTPIPYMGWIEVRFELEDDPTTRAPYKYQSWCPVIQQLQVTQS